MQNESKQIELQGAQAELPAPGAQPAPTEPSSLLAPGLMLLGVSMLLWVMVRMLIKRRQRTPLISGTPHERLETIRRQANQRAKIDGFAADAQELVQVLASQLDMKAAKIEQLIEDADERIRQLNRGVKSTTSTQPHLADSTGEQEHDSVASKVYELADQGEAPLAIARQLNQHVGQVELILALRRA